MAKITYPTKNIGDQFKATEANEIKASVNALYDEVTALDTDLDNKVDKVEGKQLSTEDYTTADKTKVGNAQLITPTTVSIVLLGDSTIAAHLGQNGVDFYLLTDEDERIGSTIINKAIAGNTINDQLSVWNADTNKATYDLIIVQVGLNDIGITESDSTVIGRYQSLVNQINATKKSSAIIMCCTMTPCKGLWSTKFGAPNVATAQAQWEALNAAIKGGGSNPITGINVSSSYHTEYLSDGDSNLAIRYDVGDAIHENNLARAIIATSWRDELSRVGFLTTTTHQANQYFSNVLNDVYLKDGNLWTRGDLVRNKLCEFKNKTQNGSSSFTFRTDGNASYANLGPCGGIKMGWQYSSNPENLVSIDLFRGSGTTDGAAIGLSTSASAGALTQGVLLSRANNLILQNGGTFTDDTVNRLQVGGSIKSTQYKLSALNTAPASATAAGTTGEIRYTATHIYVCTATNTWVRAALATW